KCIPQLAHVAQTRSLLGRLTGARKRRQQNPDRDRDDADDYEKLDQSKRAAAMHRISQGVAHDEVRSPSLTGEAGIPILAPALTGADGNKPPRNTAIKIPTPTHFRQQIPPAAVRGGSYISAFVSRRPLLLINRHA